MDELVAAYIEKRAELEAVTAKIRAEMVELEDQLRLKLAELGARSIKTAHGTVFTSQRRTAKLDNPEEFFSWASAQHPSMIKRSLDTTEALDYIDTHGEVPPGVGLSVTEVLSVRAAK